MGEISAIAEGLRPGSGADVKCAGEKKRREGVSDEDQKEDR